MFHVFLKVVYKFLWVFHGCLKDVLKKLQGCYKRAPKVLERKFQCFKSVPRKLQGCFREVSTICQKCFKIVMRVFQGSFVF